MENHKLGNGSSDLSSIDEVPSPTNDIPMSPIKRRKDIKSPTLNQEQTNFLDVCTIYKSGDFQSFSNKSVGQQRNASATPMRKENLLNKTSQIGGEETRSCTKLSLKKAKHFKKKSKRSKKSKKTLSINPSSKNSRNKVKRSPKKAKGRPDIYQNMISLDFNDQQECPIPKVKSPKKKIKKFKSLNKVPAAPNHHSKKSMEISEGVLAGLSSILQDMEKPCSPRKTKKRRRSRLITQN